MEKDNTGFAQAGFRPVSGHIGVIISDKNLNNMESTDEEPEEKKENKLSIPKKGLILPEHIQKAKDEKEATFIVACVSKAISENEDLPQVGDRVAFLANTQISEFIVNGIRHGIVPMHRIACIIDHGAKITAD